MKERIIIDDRLCRKVQLMLCSGANAAEVAELAGISETTVSRIKKAGFSAQQYEENTKKRKIEEKKKPGITISAADVIAAVKSEEEQVPGKMEMDLQPKAPEMSDQTKMMRFQAGQVEKICEKLDKIIDQLGMIMRRADG